MSAYKSNELPITSTIAHVCDPLKMVAHALSTPKLSFLAISVVSNQIFPKTPNSVSSNMVLTRDKTLISSVVGSCCPEHVSDSDANTDSSHMLRSRAHSREHREC